MVDLVILKEGESKQTVQQPNAAQMARCRRTDGRTDGQSTIATIRLQRQIIQTELVKQVCKLDHLEI